MKLTFEVYTSSVYECKAFYTEYFDFSVKLETEGFVVLQHNKFKHYELMFCLPNSPFVHPVFHPEFNGKGTILQMEVDDVEYEYTRLNENGIQIVVPLVKEDVNGYHFTIEDPSGLLVDIVQFN
ncbi:MAG: VOC family protein [Balneolaceae bacterium]|nr:VOC family protein [Balneolaceae bacterium]